VRPSRTATTSLALQRLPTLAGQRRLRSLITLRNVSRHPSAVASSWKSYCYAGEACGSSMAFSSSASARSFYSCGESLRLEAGVLLLQLGETPGFVGLHPPVVLWPVVVDGQCHLDDAADVGDPSCPG
jgi:hypothetical protein